MSVVASRRVRFDPSADRQFHRDVRQRVAHYLSQSGADRFANSALWRKAAILSAVAGLSYSAILFGSLPGWAMLGLCAAWGASTILLGLNVGHDAAHDALTRHRWINRLLHHATFALVGTDAYLWRLRHVRSHHNFPNVDGCDIDIDENPILRLSPNHPRRPWQRWQHWYAPLAYALVQVYQATWGDLAYLFKSELADLRDIRHPPTAWVGFIVGKLLYIASTFGVPLWLIDRPGWQIAMGATVASVTSSLLFIALLIGTHFAESAEFPTAGRDGVLATGWTEHVMRTSVDWGTRSRFACWLTGGANCHVAHHLFPGISHVHYQPVTALIAQCAAEHGIVYRQLTLIQMLASHVRLLRRLAV